MVARIALAGSGLFLTACDTVPRTAADLQIDIADADWTDTDKARVCIDRVTVHEAALGNGRLAIPALPDSEDFTIHVDLIRNNEMIGGAGSIRLTAAEPYVSADWIPCTDCTPCTLGSRRPADSNPDGPTLAVRFVTY